MNICMVGAGYVGLVTGACLAEKGHSVICVDVNAAVIEKLKSGVVPIYEPGLEEIARRCSAEGRLRFTCDIAEGLRDAEVCFIAVGTPSGDGGGTELKYVYAAADSVGALLSHDCAVVVKSTVPVGTCYSVLDRIESGIASRGSFARAEIISNPEFLKEGSAVNDFFDPDRVVIGAENENSREIMSGLYSSFVPPERMIFMDIASAEITKYACNAMLALRISFINEIALLCDVAGADVLAVKAGMATDPRIGGHFLNAGCGYGGSCFPKDIQALDQTGRVLGLEMKMALATSLVNERQKLVLGNMIVERFGKNLKGLGAAVLGLSFKPETDDMRYAPSIPLINTLTRLGADVTVFDPVVRDASGILPPSVKYASGVPETLAGADAAILVTEWDDFKHLDWDVLGMSMKRRILFDGRNVCDPGKMERAGFEYYCIGRGRTVNVGRP
ncbi:MAG: UDP-glucose/GDP-mannose dehydrogenase family protein [Synergistaceae bacterium]|jgi:UDPglucose 6-dehydrogenase|nr:UDP-glucose/GDP-mannose dehydrogenase family protein [Synergistaceae bacterium]